MGIGSDNFISIDLLKITWHGLAHTHIELK